LRVDENMAYNTEKIASVVDKECIYLEKDFDPKEYFENGILKKKEDENIVNKKGLLINYDNLGKLC